MREPTAQAILLEGAPTTSEALTRRPLRSSEPFDLGLFALVGQALLLACSIAATFLSSSPPTPRDALFLVLGGLIAAAQCLWAAWAARAEARTFAGWALIGVGLLAWAAADYRYYLLTEYRFGVALSTHALYFLCYAVTFLGLLAFPSAGRASGLRLALDAATVALGGAMAMSYLVLLPLAQEAGLDRTNPGVLLPYAVGDLLLLLASALLALRPLYREARPAFRWLLLAQLLSFVFGVVYSVEAIVANHFVNMKGYLLVQLLMGLAAYRHRLSASAPQLAPFSPEPLVRMSWLPYGAITLGFSSLIYAATRAGFGSLDLLVAQAAALTAVVVARQALAVRQEARLVGEREARLVEDRERRRSEAERERLLADLEAKNAELERFTYAVSHDLKGPLITIRGFVDQVKGAIEEGQRERALSDLERIASASSQMQRMLSELLELSRIGRVVNPPQTLSLRALAEQATALAGGRLAGVEVVLAPDLPEVRGDPVRLLQVLQNLFENAGQFRDAQKQPRVELGMRRDAAERVFYVRDNGIGIEPRHHDRVFGLFHKLDPRSPGSGIGLALARRIVEAHGGRLWVESEGHGTGASFCFTLPAA